MMKLILMHVRTVNYACFANILRLLFIVYSQNASKNRQLFVRLLVLFQMRNKKMMV